VATINLQPGQDGDFSDQVGPVNVYGTDGSDNIVGTDAHDNLRGGIGNDTLVGGAGDDFLDGGEGNDKVYGGVGNDTYVVQSAQDVVVELAGEGVDHVKSYISYTLRPNVENLTLMGEDNLNGSGNELNNTIKGNIGNNTLFGGDGDDSLLGLAGNDIIRGGNGNDFMDGGTGVDLVSYKDAINGVTVDLSINTKSQDTIGAGRDTLKNFENLEGSIFADKLSGDSGNNKMAGLDGNDVIRGGAGNDDITGGAGADTIVFEAAGIANGVDRIRDFQSGIDSLQFNKADYDVNALFTSSDKSEAEGAGAQFVFNTKTFALYYDADGEGGNAAIHIADFTPVTVHAEDIHIV